MRRRGRKQGPFCSHLSSVTAATARRSAILDWMPWHARGEMEEIGRDGARE
jgi:hypothetical protein